MKYEILPCTEADAKWIGEQSDSVFNIIAPPDPDAEEEETHYRVTDDEGNVIGGCTLETDDRKTASIYRLWVDEPYRRQGIASALIREAERKAKEQGCYLMLIGTFDFQAKPLYVKHGYAVIDTMQDWPKGHEHYFLAKRLDRQSSEYIPKKACAYRIQPGDEETAETLSDRLRRHDEAAAPRTHAPIPINKKVTDGNGRIIAGICGDVDGWDGTSLDSLWVDEPYRGKGIGSAILSAFEQEAKKNGASRMSVEPFDWNIGFFRKNGYEKITGALEDYPKGHTMYCMEKPI